MTTFVVTTSVDVANGDVSENDLSLREAMELASASPSADRISFADGIDYVALTDKLPTIADDLRLVGGGDVMLDANADGDFDPVTTAEEGNRRGLDIRGDNIAVTIDGLTITGGSAFSGGDGIRSGRKVDLTVVDSRIVGNGDRAEYGDTGGGIRAEGDLTLRRSIVADNVGRYEGGGIWVSGEARIVHSRIEGNKVYAGEAYTAGGGIKATNLAMRHSEVIGNTVISDQQSIGGGVRASKVTLLDCRIVENAVVIRETPGLTTGVAGGGGVSSGTLIASDTTIASNGVFNYSVGAFGHARGGGIEAPTVCLHNSEVSGNLVRSSLPVSGGGVIAIELTLTASSIVGNTAESERGASGGGIYLSGSKDYGSYGFMAGRDSTVAWNTVNSGYSNTNGGGGIFADDTPRVRLNGLTLTGNKVVGAEGAAIYASQSVGLTLKNSIVVGNSAAVGNEIVGPAKLRSSLLGGDARELFAEATEIAPGIFAGVLGENGGLTPTVALRFDRDNPAIGGADPDASTLTDQRGVVRDAHPDIGAFEATRRPGVALNGTPRQDVLQGSDARDELSGREADDLLRGLDGGDELRGGADDDTVRGNRGKDVVDGGGGNDEIFGGRNDDNLRGGAGSDRFTFFERFGVDVIEDFDARPAEEQDRIDLHHIGISAGNFSDRVTITDLGAATLIEVEDAGAILCRGVDGEGGNTITIVDFVLIS